MSRSYHQHCPLARTLDTIGDRWTMLILRNLILGPQRYSELQAGLPGIATNLLAGRLQRLVADGVLALDEDRGEYGLSDAGRELEPVIFAIAGWGERHVFGAKRAQDRIHHRFFLTSLRRKIQPTRDTATIALNIDARDYTIALGPAPSVAQEPATAPGASLMLAPKDAVFTLVDLIKDPDAAPEWRLLATALGWGTQAEA